MISIIGGFYNEYCFYPHFDEKNGSGFRACRAIRGINQDVDIKFHSYAPTEEEIGLHSSGQALNIKTEFYASDQTITFHYDHPLRTPQIYPRPDLIVQSEPIEVKDENILVYGMLEGSFKVSGVKVIYDPQSPVKPIPFSKTGSSADHLAVVINHKEAKLIAGAPEEEKIVEFFFEVEKAEVLILKMGPKGAKVFVKGETPRIVPVYKTNNVWPIGSGDIFAAIFAYNWAVLDKSAVESAQEASYATALYCNSKNYGISVTTENDFITPLEIDNYPTGKVYLAGPFFNFSQKWIINEARECLYGLGMKVFSPLHDVGEGTVDEGIADQDLKGLENCDIVFAIVDGLDSGTIFEIGYAVKMQIPVIVYAENETEGNLLMIAGTGCLIVDDFATALYKCLWVLAEREKNK
ncbi:PfkB family carbohydrate kinase [Sphingobacterium daejeonense]|uniref:PfkB family carbohydrate kinase n=1 Tax=Sphingobacterium daejeonense TaxID=371142 RepID=UPI0010C3F139|nr:PfkB family carbohydrate kinase [Sphingobacterium daejeonense]VTP87312.1 ribokinase [Sphingobacterium daejeonense]